MRILVFSTLYPNAASPSHGIFVENRLRAFRRRHDAEIKVIAPVPWFPLHHRAFGAYAEYAAAPRSDVRHGVEVYHPRYFIPPKVAMHFAPDALTRVLRDTARSLIDDGWDFDLIDAHYFFPDGVAAERVARELGKPFVITARGTDVNLLPQYKGPREKILNVARRADAIITVAAALKDALVDLGTDREKISVLRNGVDLDLFTPVDREVARAKLGVTGFVLASIGHLIERKGHHLVIEAMKDLPDVMLLIAGDGPKKVRLKEQAKTSGVQERVKFLGRVAHENLPDIYAAADALVLASSREGWPNVLLEAMACGTPCIAADVWGSGEVVRAPEAGRLFKPRNTAALTDAVKQLQSAMPDRDATRKFAERHSWDATADKMATIFRELTNKQKTKALAQTTALSLPKKKPSLIITVDTEEQFDWSRFDNPEISVDPPKGIEAFQQICARHGAMPLYFLTWPLLKNEEVASFFKGLVDNNAADCGLHLHQWVTPPMGDGGEFLGEFFSFQKNLPSAVHREKLENLANAFADVFGFRAKSHRAGRYGISPADYALLARIGVTMDFSPSVGFDFSSRGGPDFSTMSNAPFAISTQDWRVLVTPVCGARNIRRTPLFLSQANRSDMQRPGFQTHTKKTSRVANHTMAVRLSPEGAGIKDLQRLTRRLVQDGTPVLTFTLHSSSLTPGQNPYAQDQDGVERILKTTSDFLDWFRAEIGGEILTLDELQLSYAR